MKQNTTLYFQYKVLPFIQDAEYNYQLSNIVIHPYHSVQCVCVCVGGGGCACICACICACVRACVCECNLSTVMLEPLLMCTLCVRFY